MNNTTRIALTVIVLAIVVSTFVDCGGPRQSPRDALMRRIERLHRQTQADYNRELETGERDQVAGFIRDSIVPEYAAVSEQVDAFMAVTENDIEWQTNMVVFLTVMSSGWETMADALDQGNIVKEGEALEFFDEAMGILESQGFQVERPARDTHAEIALFLLADSRFDRRLAELVQTMQSDAELADAVERDAVPEWTTAVERFRAATIAPPAEYQRSVSRLIEYAVLRTDSTAFQLDGLRDGDDAKGDQAVALIRQAREIRQTIMREGLIEDSP